MKTYEQFQYERLDESIINRVAGAANRMRQGASKMIGGANKAMSRAGSTMGKVGRNVASSVPKAASQVQKTTSNVRKEFGQNSRAGRFKAANVLGNRNVRSGLSALKNVAGNIRGKTYTGGGLTKAFTSGSGVGSEIKQGVQDRKKFERSKVVQYNKPTKDRFGNVTGGKNASGQKLPNTRTVVQRGRELDKDGNAIERGKRGKGLLNKVTSRLRRNIGLSDVKGRVTPDETAKSNVPAKKPEITGPKGFVSEPAKSGSKSKGTGSVTTNVGGGSEINPKTGKKIIKKNQPTTTKGGTKITDGGGSRFTGDTTIEKGDDGKVKVTQKPGEGQKVVTSGNRQYFARPTDKPERLKQTTKRPPGSIQSRITGDIDRSDIVTDVDKKGVKGAPGQAVKMPGTEQQKTNPRRIEKQIKNTTPSRGGEGATEDSSTSPKVTYGKKNKPKVTKNTKKTDKVGTPKASETKVTTNKTETKKQSLGDRVKANVEKGVNVDDGKGSYKPVVNKKETSNDKKSGAGRPEGTKNKSTQLSLMKSLNKPSAPSNSSERTKKQIQQQQSANDPRRPGSDDLSDGGNTERATTYKPPSKIESQNIQTKSVINQSRKKNQSGTKKSKGGDAKSGGGNQKENRNPIKKKIVKNVKKNPKKTNESFSHWREEFLWEVDKKYPEKVKEIKPMSGKNTITINPEDESSKYKRGY
jgi:hypothetical protein